MHNVHLIRIKAENAEDACNAVEIEIEDFGDENNWRTICGAIGEDGEVYENDKGRWSADDFGSIEELNKVVRGWLEPNDFSNGKANEALTKPENERTSMDWYFIEKWAKDRGAKVNVNSDFDVLKDTLKEYQYEENGVTDLSRNNSDGKTYIVIVDMHS